MKFVDPTPTMELKKGQYPWPFHKAQETSKKLFHSKQTLGIRCIATRQRFITYSNLALAALPDAICLGMPSDQGQAITGTEYYYLAICWLRQRAVLPSHYKVIHCLIQSKNQPKLLWKSAQNGKGVGSTNYCKSTQQRIFSMLMRLASFTNAYQQDTGKKRAKSTWTKDSKGMYVSCDRYQYGLEVRKCNCHHQKT
ncbi:hypothetical protein PoB_006750600 [Plakobranchus ocellatus]|uniref:BACK domain-containing protein n=1 Tax=Plakobranchus ocellatus TaxID=259542 RepID=A0AAV4DAB4_9GAST|nr:hypothetical protein PoB_006750600 [Plakobranchus ocellatus]